MCWNDIALLDHDSENSYANGSLSGTGGRKQDESTNQSEYCEQNGYAKSERCKEQGNDREIVYVAITR